MLSQGSRALGSGGPHVHFPAITGSEPRIAVAGEPCVHAVSPLQHPLTIDGRARRSPDFLISLQRQLLQLCLVVRRHRRTQLTEINHRLLADSKFSRKLP